MTNPVQHYPFRKSRYCSVGGMVGGGSRVEGSKKEGHEGKGKHQIIAEETGEEDLEAFIQTMAAALDKKVLHYKGKIGNIQKQLKAAEGSEIYLRQGDALSQNRHLYKKRMERIAVPDWSQINSEGEAETLEIELDPEKGLTANAELFYKKYRKGKRALERLEPMMEKAEKEILILQRYQKFLQEKASILTGLKERGNDENRGEEKERLVEETRQLLEDLYSKLIREKILVPDLAQKAARTSEEASSSFQKNKNSNQAQKKNKKHSKSSSTTLKDIDKFTSPSGIKCRLALNTQCKHDQVRTGGFTVLAGRSASANEHVSFQLTKRNQVWFHVRNLPGSHVLIRADFDKIAAWHSHGKDETRVEVSYCKGSQVKNPPARHKKLGAVSIMGQEQV
eukprot:jgi/Bigna1/90160/estExt_fgenesh1_pg.C_640003